MQTSSCTFKRHRRPVKIDGAVNPECSEKIPEAMLPVELLDSALPCTMCRKLRNIENHAETRHGFGVTLLTNVDIEIL